MLLGMAKAVGGIGSLAVVHAGAAPAAEADAGAAMAEASGLLEITCRGGSSERAGAHE